MKIFYVNIILVRRSADATYGVTIRFFPQFLTFKVAPEAFRANLSTSAIRRRCAVDPLEQMVERCQLQPATTSQVGLRNMRTRLKEIFATNNFIYSYNKSRESTWLECMSGCSGEQKFFLTDLIFIL